MNESEWHVRFCAERTIINHFLGVHEWDVSGENTETCRHCGALRVYSYPVQIEGASDDSFERAKAALEGDKSHYKIIPLCSDCGVRHLPNCADVSQTPAPEFPNKSGHLSVGSRD